MEPASVEKFGKAGKIKFVTRSILVGETSPLSLLSNTPSTSRYQTLNECKINEETPVL